MSIDEHSDVSCVMQPESRCQPHQPCQPYQSALKIARWHNHVNRVQAPRYLQSWLTETGSLTARLIAYSSSFRVQRIYQKQDFCQMDEYAALGLHKIAKVHAREVLLHCDGAPTIYAHTVLPLTANSSQWPRFKKLGEKSLGSTLFNDPQVRRGTLQFARLSAHHPAVRRVQLLVPGKIQADRPLFARRSLFSRRGGVMLVTELFLPSVFDLSSPT